MSIDVEIDETPQRRPPAGRHVRCPTLVGMQAKRAFLEHSLEEAAAGEGGLVCVLGPAGIGKTRLVDEMRTLARHRGMMVLTGRALDRVTPDAYRPFAEAALPLLHPVGGSDDPRLAPFRSALASLGPGGSPDEQLDELALTEGLARLFSGAGDTKGCLVVLEDLHWSDPETLEIVEGLAHRLVDRPVLCVATVRSGVSRHVERRMRVLDERRIAPTVELAPLSSPQLGEMVERCLGAAPVPAVVTDFVREHADGIPLFVEELLQGLLDEERLVHEDGGWQVVGSLAPRVPLTFTQTIQRRLDGLTEDGRAAIRAAAVIGREVDDALLAATVGMSRTELSTALHEVVDTGLLVHDRQESLRFRHALAREVIIDQMLPAERAAIARDGLEALDAAEDDSRSSLVADLAGRAGDNTRAVDALLQAARESLQRGALASSDRALQRARDITGEPDTLVAIEEMEAHAAALGGHVHRAEKRAQRALAGEGSAQIPTSMARRVRLEAVLARTAVAGGRWHEAEEHVQQAMSLFDPDTMPAALGARVQVLAGQVAASRGRVDEAMELASNVVDDASPHPVAATSHCEALEILGRCVRPDDVDEAEALFQHALRLADRHELPLWRARALHELGTIDVHRWTLRRDRLEAARDAALDLGAVATAALAELHLCVTAVPAWDPPRGLRHGRRCVRLSREHDLATLAPGLVHLGIAHAFVDDEPAMEAVLDEAAVVGGGAPEIAAGIPGKARMVLALRRGDLETACTHLDEAAAILRRQPDQSFPFWGLWALLATVTDRDGSTARECARHFGGQAIAPNDTCLHLADAVATGRAGHATEAAEMVAETSNRRAMANPTTWRCLLLAALGEAAVRDGWGDGAAWLREALAGFEARGLPECASRCRTVLRRQGLPVPRHGTIEEPVPPALAADGITGREVDVLRLLTEDLSNPEIAERLHISRRTVERHVSNLLDKTGCHDRHGLARLADDTAVHG